MKNIFKALTVLLAVLLVLSGCSGTNTPDTQTCEHIDADDNGRCDTCDNSVIVIIDFYAINDLHGKFKDTDSNEGVDELTTFLRRRYKEDDNVVLLSSGDMWQGSSESNLTKGLIITDWMNDLDFASMTLGNYEYDWGEEFIQKNDKAAEFPFLAINVYSRKTNERVEYCDASAVIERNGVKIGIIGAIGDCYSSISGDKSGGFYIKTGGELTALVKKEAQRLRQSGVDYIVYSIHDGYGQNVNGTQSATERDLDNYYDISLSDGYVDLVFEGHTHKKYVLVDEYDVHHLQNGGENKGISHVEIKINSVTGTSKTNAAHFISIDEYLRFSDDAIVDNLLDKYKDDISMGDAVLGQNDRKLDAGEIKKLIAKLYYEYGVEKWGEEYDIALGGGYLNTRSPYDLAAGQIKYSHLQSILPFDNNLVLCSIQGSDLKEKFFESSNSNYYIYYGDYGAQLKGQIDPNGTYYIIVDSYTSTYAPNKLTEIERIEDELYARDLLAEYIKNGGLTSGN